MQENRSFDSYFGTFPGANGFPPGVCVPDPLNGGCVTPFHDPADLNYGGPHGQSNATADIDGGRMDGYVGQAEKGQGCSSTNPNCSPCTTSSTSKCVDVMGYHDAREIPNYWRYAQDYVLHDNMFEPNASWSLPEHPVSGVRVVGLLHQPAGTVLVHQRPAEPQPARGGAVHDAAVRLD